MDTAVAVKEPQRSLTPSSHLGKRKRSASPDKSLVNGNAYTPDSNIESLLRDIKRYKSAPSLLEQTLPDQPRELPQLKKQKIDVEDNTIDSRLALEGYDTTDALIADLRTALDLLRTNRHLVNGHTENDEANDLDKIENVIAQYSRSDRKSGHGKQPVTISAGQVLTLRSSTEGGATKQLFTGLRIQPSKNVELDEIDPRKLPSGFDVVDASAFPATPVSSSNDTRTFGDTFRQLRYQRQLEEPSTSKPPQSSLLNFTQPFEVPSTSKDDYRIMPTNAGTWLQYSVAGPSPRNATPRLNNPRQDPQALFNAAFSSFAPTEDNTLAIVSRAERSRLWYRKKGEQAVKGLFTNSLSGQDSSSTQQPEIDDTFQQLIDDWAQVTPEEVTEEREAVLDDAEDVLQEIGDLLKTLASYQYMRDSDKNRTASASTKPTGPEADYYKLLHSHLKVLVATLPPFAVAKLDGDQLHALNISQNIMVQIPDTPGTGQPDEGTLSRQRLQQTQQAALNRPLPQPPVRNSYTATATPAANYVPPAAYAPPARSYAPSGTHAPSLPGYAQRKPMMYSTPNSKVAGPSYHPSQPFAQTQQPYPGATIQQYQRMQNGYTPNTQTPYQPRPSQTPQQQQQSPMQNNTQYVRSASPSKPLTNGQQTPQQQQFQGSRNQYSTPAPSTSLLQGPYAQANAHATIQQLKAAQSAQSQSQSPQPQPMQGVQQANVAAVAAQQRQQSGTPQPVPNTPGQQSAQIIPDPQKASNNISGQIGGITQSIEQRNSATPQPVQASSVGA